MIELKYKITDADVKAEDKKNSLEYFALYLAIGLVGLAVGITAVVLRHNTALFVLGIIVLVLAGLLCLISLLLALPHNPALKSAVPTGDDELTVRLDDNGVSVYAGEEQLAAYGYARFIGMRKRDSYLKLTVEKNVALFIKCESKDRLESVYEFMCAKLGKKSKKSNGSGKSASVESVDSADARDDEQTARDAQEATDAGSTVDSSEIEK